MKKLQAAMLLTFLALPIGSVFGQNEPSPGPIDELERSRALLNELQDRFGAMDVRLLEPLEQMADRLMLASRFDEAHVMLDRAMQIARVEEGLYTEVQRPLLEKKIENFANRGDWEDAREGMDHLLWLYSYKSRRIDQALIDDLLELSRLHLRALAEDASFFQGYHFRQSTRIRWLALGVAGRLWGNTDERLVPIIYEQIRQFHLQSVALEQGGPTSYSLRQIAPDSGILRERRDVNESYYLSGVGLIDSLFAVYAQNETPNPEAIAMTNVYLGDWHLLYSKPGVAEESYRQAYQEFLAAGVDAQLLNEFFSQPIVIPDANFYASVESAVAAQRNKMVKLDNGDSDVYLSFNEWSTALPNVSSPLSGYGGESVSTNSNIALFSFNLAGVNKVSRWFSHRYSSTINQIEQAELLAHYLEFSPREDQLLEKLTSLTFRPKLVDGQPQNASGRLQYQLAGDGPNFSFGDMP